MSFLSVLIGALVGGLVSSGAIIGITFLGALVPWWALLLISIGGTIIGGFIAGLIAKGAGSGALAGGISGIFVLIAVFLFVYFYYQAQILALISSAPDVPTIANDIITMLGMDGTPVGTKIVDWIVANAPTKEALETFATTKFIYFGLIVGVIFGFLAAIVNFFAGMIGGLITKKKKDSYNSYY